MRPYRGYGVRQTQSTSRRRGRVLGLAAQHGNHVRLTGYVAFVYLNKRRLAGKGHAQASSVCGRGGQDLRLVAIS